MKLLLNEKSKTGFENYRCSSSLPVLKAYMLFAAVFNALLLIPDLMNLSHIAVMIIVPRVAYSLIVFSAYFWISRLATFALRCAVVTLYDVVSVALFLYVYHQYPPEDYLIQLLGMMCIVAYIFVVPNRWGYKMCVGAVSVAAFTICASRFIPHLSISHFVAGTFYLILVLLCSAWLSAFVLRREYREYVVKTKLERIYATDPLTKVGNRVRLEEAAQEWMAHCEKHNLPLSLVLLDVDNLKRINDVHGHLVGDTVLYETAQILRTKLRPDDVCIRWGGDEFILLLPCTNAEEAESLASAVRDAITDYEFSAQIEISCSFGIATMKQGQSLNQMIAEADAAMYIAKELGKNAIHLGDYSTKAL